MLGALRKHPHATEEYIQEGYLHPSAFDRKHQFQESIVPMHATHPCFRKEQHLVCYGYVL